MPKLKALLRYEFTDAVRSPVASERVKISFCALTLCSEAYGRSFTIGRCDQSPPG